MVCFVTNLQWTSSCCTVLLAYSAFLHHLQKFNTHIRQHISRTFLAYQMYCVEIERKLISFANNWWHCLQWPKKNYQSLSTGKFEHNSNIARVLFSKHLKRGCQLYHCILGIKQLTTRTARWNFQHLTGALISESGLRNTKFYITRRGASTLCNKALTQGHCDHLYRAGSARHNHVSIGFRTKGTTTSDLASTIVYFRAKIFQSITD